MYEKLKKVVKKVVPSAILKGNEELLRKVVALKYAGNNQQCNICDFKVKEFVVLENSDVLCPKCGSLSRTRRLWSILEPEITSKRILHFSPSKSIRTKLNNSDAQAYVTTDFVGEFDTEKHLDITNIDEPDDTYDIIICYHILEHIAADTKAMSELFRVLKPNGSCYIQTPFKEGDTYENPEIITDEGRLEHFGQEDHLRIYSTSGLITRLQSVGFKIKHLGFNDSATNWNGFKQQEDVIVASKI